MITVINTPKPKRNLKMRRGNIVVSIEICPMGESSTVTVEKDDEIIKTRYYVNYQTAFKFAEEALKG